MIDFGTARDLAAPRGRKSWPPRPRCITEGYAPAEQIIARPEPPQWIYSPLSGLFIICHRSRLPEGYYTARRNRSQLSDGRRTGAPDQRWFFDLIKTNLAEDVNARVFFRRREIKPT